MRGISMLRGGSNFLVSSWVMKVSFNDSLLCIWITNGNIFVSTDSGSFGFSTPVSAAVPDGRLGADNYVNISDADIRDGSFDGGLLDLVNYGWDEMPKGAMMIDVITLLVRKSLVK